MFKSKDAVLNFIYSMGAAVVIFGALVKMTHLPIPGVSGNFILGLGLAVECFIFIVFAFNQNYWMLMLLQNQEKL